MTSVLGEDVSDARPRAQASTSMEEFDQLEGRVLVAEDNPTNQEVALGILSKLGVRADAVANGDEVVDAVKTIPYDLVLMDVQMPQVDGLEATRRIRDQQSDVQCHDVPIIAMTAHAMEGDRDRCLQAGMDDYIPKPVTPYELARMLKKWLPDGDERDDSTVQDAADAPGMFYDADGPVWDTEALLERLVGDEELLRTVIEEFLKDTPTQIAELSDAVEGGDASGAERIAHTIKGAAANVGAERIRAVALNIEQAAASDDLQTADAGCGDLKAELETLRKTAQETIESLTDQ